MSVVEHVGKVLMSHGTLSPFYFKDTLGVEYASAILRGLELRKKAYTIRTSCKVAIPIYTMPFVTSCNIDEIKKKQRSRNTRLRRCVQGIKKQKRCRKRKTC